VKLEIRKKDLEIADYGLVIHKDGAEVFGVLHHLQFVQVVKRGVHGNWRAARSPCQYLVDALEAADPGQRLMTVRLPGHAGRWLCLMTPHAE
jgi:hypothetical protein